MGKIDALAKSAGGKKDKGGMKEAADSAEEIRKWVSLTSDKAGMTKVQVKAYQDSFCVFLTT